MSNDYLWDKRGTDHEVEKLESLLSDLRYQPTAPPALPQKELLFARERPWWRLSLAYTFVGLVFAAFLVGAWMIASRDEVSVSNQFGRSGPDPAKSTNRQTTLTDLPDPADNNQVMSIRNLPVRTLYVPERRRPGKRIVPAKTVVSKPKQPFESLTSEEKYAYEQLKLALAITGSRLKSVSDTINRTED